MTERGELGTDSDRTLVAAARAGDDRAFEQLYERYQRRIAAYVYGMVNDFGRAEDITQDVFISALRRMRETDRPIAFKPWIYEIAKNACIDQFRRGRRTEEVSYDSEDVRASETAGRAFTTGSPDDVVAAKQQLDDLCGAFGGLSETHHQILVLREFEGMSYREIGEVMGLSRPSVESTLFRARRRLTEEYEELISGQRCLRVQTIISSSGPGLLGMREQRRLARHVARCQPCRRDARLAGFDSAGLESRPARNVMARVAGFLPLPLLRGRGGASASAGGGHGVGVSQWTGSLAGFAEPLVAGWAKIAAAAVVLAGAGAGAGVVTMGGGTAPASKSPAPGMQVRGDRAVAPESTRAANPRPGRRAARPATQGGQGAAPASATAEPTTQRDAAARPNRAPARRLLPLDRLDSAAPAVPAAVAGVVAQGGAASQSVDRARSVAVEAVGATQGELQGTRDKAAEAASTLADTLRP